MKKFYSNKELSEKLVIPLTKIRRYSGTILDPDEEATRQSGKSRKLSKKEAFLIYLCAHLVTKMGMVMDEAEAIIHDISPWLEANGFFPDSPKGKQDDTFYYDYINEKDELVPGERPWYFPIEIQIMRANTPSGFFYRTIKEIPDSRKIRKIKGRQVTEIQFEEGYILTYDQHYIIDNLNVYLLKISALVHDFDSKIEGRVRF